MITQREYDVTALENIIKITVKAAEEASNKKENRAYLKIVSRLMKTYHREHNKLYQAMGV